MIHIQLSAPYSPPATQFFYIVCNYFIYTCLCEALTSDHPDLGRASIKKIDFLGNMSPKLDFFSPIFNISIEPVLRRAVTIQKNDLKKKVFRACWVFFTFCLEKNFFSGRGVPLIKDISPKKSTFFNALSYWLTDWLVGECS